MQNRRRQINWSRRTCCEKDFWTQSFSCPFAEISGQQPLLIVIAVLMATLSAGFSQVRSIPLDNLNEMQLRNVKAECVTHKGRKALAVSDAAPARVADGIQLVILNRTEFQDGVIEIDLAGEPGRNAGDGARGFVGVAFHLSFDAAKDA